MKSSLHVAIGLFLVGWSTVWAQTQIHEKDYTLTYFPTHLTIAFHDGNASQSLHIEDALTQAPVPFDRSANSNQIVLNQLRPSQLIKLRYTSAQRENQTSVVANASISSGSIEVYFNHTVATLLAQTQESVNLAAHLDQKWIYYINQCKNYLEIAMSNS